MIKEAKAEAKTIVGDAEAKATSIRDEAQARAEREANQISQEMVASARQGNQKELLDCTSWCPRCYVRCCEGTTC